MKHCCPECGAETSYRAFSGGREWYCESCEASGEYPEGEEPRRAGLLRSWEGMAQLRKEMEEELKRRRRA